MATRPESAATWNRLRRRTPHEASEHGFELLDRRGLEQMIVEAGVDRAPAIVGVAVPGERDQDAWPSERAQTARERVAVHVGQTDRDERKLDRESLDERERRGGIERHVHRVPERLQQELQAVCRVGMRIDDQELRRRFRRPVHAWTATLRESGTIVACIDAPVTSPIVGTVGRYAATTSRVQYRRQQSNRTQ